MQKKKIQNIEMRKSNDLNFGLADAYKEQFRKMEYDPKKNNISLMKGMFLNVEKDNYGGGGGGGDMGEGIKSELLKKELERQKYEEILRDKTNKNNTLNGGGSGGRGSGGGSSGGSGSGGGNSDLQQSLMELVNTSSITNSLLSNISSNMGVSNKNPNNISNINGFINVGCF